MALAFQVLHYVETVEYEMMRSYDRNVKRKTRRRKRSGSKVWDSATHTRSSHVCEHERKIAVYEATLLRKQITRRKRNGKAKR